MSLKQKIRQKAESILKRVDEERVLTIIEKGNVKRFLSYFYDDVDDALDEATKELLNLAIHGLQEAQNGESSDCASTFATIIEKLGIHVEYDEWHEPIIDAEQVKAVLEGAEQK